MIIAFGGVRWLREGDGDYVGELGDYACWVFSFSTRVCVCTS